MFPEVGATELVVIGVVALLVVGPKDLPVLLRKLGQWMSKIRGLAAEFKSSFNEMARQSELDDLRKEVEALRNVKYDPIGASDLQSNFDEIKSSLNDVPAGLNEWEEGKLYNPDEPEAASDAESLGAPKPKRAAKPKPTAKPTAKTAQAKPAPARKTVSTKTAAAPKAAAPKPATPKPPVQKAAAPKAAAKKTPAKKGKA